MDDPLKPFSRRKTEQDQVQGESVSSLALSANFLGKLWFSVLSNLAPSHRNWFSHWRKSHGRTRFGLARLQGSSLMFRCFLCVWLEILQPTGSFFITLSSLWSSSWSPALPTPSSRVVLPTGSRRHHSASHSRFFLLPETEIVLAFVSPHFDLEFLSQGKSDY